MSLGIKGFTPTSLIDWPGKIVSVIFLPGCSFRCHYCYNPEFIENNYAINDMDDKMIFNYFKQKKKWLDGVILLGGEPTIHKNFLKIINQIKDLDLKIGVHTNGTNPSAIEGLLNKNILNFIAMDIKSSLESYPKIVNTDINPDLIIESVNLIKNSNIDYEFRTTVVPGLVDKKEIEKIGKWLSGSKKFFIQQFKPGKTLNPKYEKLKAYKVPELLEMKKKAEPYFQFVDIRGIQK